MLYTGVPPIAHILVTGFCEPHTREANSNWKEKNIKKTFENITHTNQNKLMFADITHVEVGWLHMKKGLVCVAARMLTLSTRRFDER